MPKTAHRHLRSVSYDLNNDLSRIKEAIADATGDVKDKTGQMLLHSYSNVKKKSADIQDSVSTYVAQKPLKSVGFAILSGVVLGYLLHK